MISATRRQLLKWCAAAPVLTAVAGRRLSARLRDGARPGSSAEVYCRLGVRPLINARGTWTYLSGSLELPQVRQAMDAAARHFVDIFELQRAVGRRLAEISGAESGMVTAGAAAAMAAATAACIAGTEPAKIWQLPDTTGLKNEVVMLGGRIAFDSAIRLVGAKLIIANSLEELSARMTEKTAMVYTTWCDERLEKALAITKNAGIPLLLDDAAGIPPFENISRYAKLGVDLYCFSGGKGLCGPQCSGLLLGRRDLIEAALANYNPWEGAICRPMKVGKEEIIGVLAAVEAWSRMDLAALDKTWTRRLERVARLVETVPGVTTQIGIPTGGNRYPTLTVRWDEKHLGLTVAQCDRQLREGEPRIEVLTSHNPSILPVIPEQEPKSPGAPERPDELKIVSMTLQEGEELIVGQRLREIFNAARRKPEQV